MIRRRAMVVIALSVTIFTATTSVLAGLYNAPAAFAAGEGYVIASVEAPTIFSSKVDMEMAFALEQMEQVTGVSPEVFAFSSWGGESFVVRGVDFDRLASVGPVLDTEMAGDAGSVGHGLLGERLAGRLGLSLPCTVPLAGSYSTRIEVVPVVGTFSSGSSLDDEMLVDVDIARRLSGMHPGEASVIRVATSEPEWLDSLLTPSSARFTLFNMSISKSRVGPDEECTIGVTALNWGGSNSSATVTFADDGADFDQIHIDLDASSMADVQAVFASASVGGHNITISIGGDSPVTMWTEVEVVGPYLVSSFGSSLLMGSPLVVRVATYQGAPAPGVQVTLADSVPSSNTTDATGACTILADEAGTFQVTFDTDGTAFAGMDFQGPDEVEVLDPASFSPEFLPEVTSLSISPSSVKEGESAVAMVTVENAGLVAGTATVLLAVDSVPYATVEVPLGSAGRAAKSIPLGSLSPGSYVVQAGDLTAVLEVKPWYSEDPDFIELVVRYGDSISVSSSGSVLVYQAAKISEGNVSLALTSLGVVAALLATLAIVSAFSKELHDGRKKLGIMRALGASREKVRAMAFRQALVASLAGSAAGVGAGMLVSMWLVSSGAFSVVGHVLEFGVDLGLVVLTLAGVVAISLVSAVASAEFAVRESAMSSIRDLPEEEAPEQDPDLPPEGP
ncbi:MAG: FtsX-like permease family protein [Candidatus Thermoplasmatota archaeon]